MRDPLECTIAELKFCSRYIETGKADEAMQYAFGYSAGGDKGYTNADRVLKKPRVMFKIAEMRHDLEEKLQVGREAVVSELAGIAFANISDYIETYDNDLVRLKDMGSLTRSATRAIKSVTIVDGHVKLELYDKNVALKQLSKVLGLEAPDVTVNATQYVIRVPEPAKSSEEWQKSAKAFLELSANSPDHVPPMDPVAPQSLPPHDYAPQRAPEPLREPVKPPLGPNPNWPPKRNWER
ncbi:MAG: terminase small subunit [Rhodomicrobium sp.]